MLFLVIAPLSFVNSMIGTAYVVFARVTFTVLVQIRMTLYVNSGNVMSAGGSMPVICLVRCPDVVFSIFVLVVIVPLTNVADTVVVDVDMISFVLNVDKMVTRNSVPVLVFVYGPLFFICMLVVVIPSANVTYAVPCLILVLRISALYVVSAGGSVPMIFIVVGISALIDVLVIVIPFAHVTNRVVVFVFVRRVVLGVCVTATGGEEIVMSFIVRVFFFILVLTENVVASIDVTIAVIVTVLMRTGNGFTALVTLKVLVLVLM